MKNNEIKSVLINTLSLEEVHIANDGNHFQVIAVGDIFDGMSRVEKQKAIYTPLMKYILNNCIHSISIKAYTPKEWKYKQDN